MASPFNSFRKNKKVWFAFLTVVAMITFVLSPGSVRVGCGRQAGQEYAVTTTTQSLTMQDLHQLVQLRDRTNSFAHAMEEVRYKAAAKRNAPRIEQQPRAVDFGGNSLRDVFDSWLKVQKASDLGITISQKTVTDYIRTQSGGAMTTQQFNQFLKQAEISEMGLYAALEKELLAQRVDELYGFGRTAARLELTPAEQKEVWDREHRRAYVQVLALPVADFARLVREPSDGDLKQFFDARRNLALDPNSPNFGFQLPYLAQFQYLRVFEPRFYEAAMKAITPEEIGHRYEEEKGKKVPAPFMNHNEENWKKDVKEEKEKGKSEADSKTAPGKASSAKAGGEKPAADKPKADAKSGGGGASLTPPRRAPREATPGDSYPVALGTEGQEERSAGALLAQADPAKTAEKAADAKTTETKTTDAKTGPDAKQPGKTADVKEPSTTPSGSAPSGSAPADPFKSRPPGLKEVLDNLTIPNDIQELQPGKDPEKVKPLWQVETNIREQLAREMANNDARKLLELINKPLDEYGKKYAKWSSKTKKTDQDKPVNPLDEEASARKIINEAWETLVKDKKDALKKTFEERKKTVDEQVKKLLEAKHITAEQFKKLAAERKNANWEGLLKEQERLANPDKLTNEALKAWEDRVSANRVKLPWDTAATPEKKAEPAKGEKTDGAKAGDTKAGDTKAGDTKAGDTKTGEAKTSDAKTSDAKTTDAKKEEPTEPVISLQKTDRGRDKDGHEEAGLDKREFLRRKYPLAGIALDGNKSFIETAFTSGSLFQPQFGFGRDEQYLVWRIAERPTNTLTWEDPKTKEVVPATREIVLQKYRETLARKLALERAQELANEIGRDTSKFPTAEVQRLFRLDPFETTMPTPSELTANDRKSLAFSEVDPVYTVVAELYDEGTRKPVSPAGAPPQGPLEAPPPGDVSGQPWFFADEAHAREYATRLVLAQHNPKVLAIVAMSVGEAAGQRVFQGLEGFRWQEKPEKSASGAEPTDENKNVVSGPGRLAGRTFPVPIGSGDTAATLKVTGERVTPFTWDQLPESVDDTSLTGLVAPGAAFGETVFKLAMGDLGAALNRPQTIAYVVQVTGYDYYFKPRDMFGVASVYPADTTLETSPLHQRFIADCRAAVAAENAYERQAQLYAQFQQQPPPPPQSVLFRYRRQEQEVIAWREALYREYGVSNEQLQRLSERGSRE